MNGFIEFLLQYGLTGLILVAFAEASFFPIPPDTLLVPLVLVEPGRGFWYAFVCTIASAAGSLFGHFLGKQAGRPLLERFVQGSRLARVEDLFQKYGGWAVAFSALTPVPYKVFTVAAGVFFVKPRVVFVGSLLGRGLRFFFETLVVDIMGPTAVAFLKNYSGPATFGLGVLLIGLAVWYTWYRKKHCK